MMGVLVRVLLAAGSGAAALLVDPGAPDFPVVQGMLAIVIAVLAFAAAEILLPVAARRMRGRGTSASGASAPAPGRDGGAAPERQGSGTWAP